ncbi:MAG: hypothetical protein H6619_03460 [Deltaproteobacteria bacterium]|nr:hypothetical protein [Deltaproteobacteria bacterium]
MIDRDNIKKLKEQIDRWSTEIDDLEVKAKRASSDAKIKYLDLINDLKAKRDTAFERYHEVADAGSSSIAHIQKGFVNAWSELGNGLEKAKTELGL